MKAIIYILFFISTIVQAQIWEGTYCADDTCSTNGCCCFSGQVKVINASSIIKVLGSMKGSYCNWFPTLTVAAYPSGYNASIPIQVIGQNISLMLSNDSSTVTVNIPLLPQCRIRVVRINSTMACSATDGFGVQNRLAYFLLCLIFVFHAYF